MKEVPANFKDLLEDETKAYAFLATLMPDGSPQITPVWFSVEGDHILINTNQGRVKDRNMRDRPKVAMAIVQPGNLHRYLQVRGEVVEIITEGAVEHIHKLSKIYDGMNFNLPPNHKRVIFKIKPSSWSHYSY